ncbi:quinoprotein relay system zinc metallohydrolase 1 [Caenispirillum bisanense]|uniref:Quinoprotein relay system zinc metallohydrolase 1 n=1 Tax=Caenispirillum bisanense TaxID=414052 RepID=A0A286GDR7_9PROT|nr:quinoprotein relay system zinc metallohydrolase 1 [Caenispirillum bisanense]SOD93663.1 quinoprotein relay system zinc metallohydrolase 1 [Caenispirillum bisanense]
MTRAAFALGLALLVPAPTAAAQDLTYALAPMAVALDTYVVEGRTEFFDRRNGGNIVNTAFIVTDAGVVVVDDGPSRRYGEELRAAIARVTDKPVVKVFVTHLHPDHFLGGQAFADVPVAATAATRAGIAAEGMAVTENLYRLSGDWMRGTEPMEPTETIAEGEQVVEIGGHRLRLLPLQGHTDSDLVLLDETTGVLFASDLVFHDRAPTFPHADAAEWLAALDRLAALDVAVVVPGHGPVARDGGPIAQTRDYVQWLDQALRTAADEGREITEVIRMPIPERFAGMALVRDELARSVLTLYPALARAALPVVGN